MSLYLNYRRVSVRDRFNVNHFYVLLVMSWTNLVIIWLVLWSSVYVSGLVQSANKRIERVSTPRQRAGKKLYPPPDNIYYWRHVGEVLIATPNDNKLEADLKRHAETVKIKQNLPFYARL